MRRRTFLAEAAVATGTAVAGCNGVLGGGGSTRSHGGYFVLRTATHNDFAGEYLLDGIERNGTTVESFEDGLGDVEEIELDETQSYEVVDDDGIDGTQSLYYEFGAQETKAASNSHGHLQRPMAVVDSDRLAVWVKRRSAPQDDIRVGWGFEGTDPWAFAFNLHRETTRQVHVQTNQGDGTNENLGFVAPDQWVKYEFAELDWEAGSATARVETEGGEEVIRRTVNFEPPEA